MSKFERSNIQCSMFNTQFSMKKVILVFHVSLFTFHSSAQTVTQKLQKSFAAFEKDPQLKHAISSLYVIDANTGQVVYNKNSQIGLAPASTQKIITSVVAFELLGKDYKYKTEFLKTKGNTPPHFDELTIRGHGDPTLGTWRYNNTKPEVIFSKVAEAMKLKKIEKINGPIATYNNAFESVQIPAGWIWEDIGNYYGAGSSEINWKENQYDLWMKPGKNKGDSVIILRSGLNEDLRYINEIRTGTRESGDNAYIFFDPTVSIITVRGTIPCCVDSFKISGYNPHPAVDVANELRAFLNKEKPVVLNYTISSFQKGKGSNSEDLISVHYSPTLDSIIYWFNKKSVNLYGEALIKTFAYEKNGFGSTDSGVAIVKKFWKDKGMDEDEINIVDGSGLSPLNRVTTHSQVEILKYAKSKYWFPYFFNSLPEYNGMKIKSGTIRGVKGFCGYHKAKNGKEYIFSFLVNNYNGSASALVNKMYKVLDLLK